MLEPKFFSKFDVSECDRAILDRVSLKNHLKLFMEGYASLELTLWPSQLLGFDFKRGWLCYHPLL